MTWETYEIEYMRVMAEITATAEAAQAIIEELRDAKDAIVSAPPQEPFVLRERRGAFERAFAGAIQDNRELLARIRELENRLDAVKRPGGVPVKIVKELLDWVKAYHLYAAANLILRAEAAIKEAENA